MPRIYNLLVMSVFALSFSLPALADDGALYGHTSGLTDEEKAIEQEQIEDMQEKYLSSGMSAEDAQQAAGATVQMTAENMDGEDGEENVTYKYKKKDGLFDGVEMPQKLFNNVP